VDLNKDGIYNLGGRELLSRYDFTLRIAEHFSLNKKLIEKIKTSDLKQPAPRPLKSGLIILKAETELNYKPLSLKEAFIAMAKAQAK
jgi:dTDP-4-dehydrorhamnose reductase